MSISNDDNDYTTGTSKIYIKSDGSRKLVKIDSNLTSAKYIQFLKDNSISDLDVGEIFQVDGAQCHKLHATQQSLVDGNVTILKDLPVKSSNLNIIERMWLELKRRVCQKNPWRIRANNISYP